MSTQRGIPGIRGTDHIGFTVPDLDEAHAFLVDVLGCDEVYTLDAKRSDDDDWMQTHLGVHPRTVIREIRFYRLGNGANFEVFLYRAADHQRVQPRNSDIGGYHIAFYVDDLDAAVQYLRDKDVDVMGEPTASRQSATGQRWIYFRSPWGLQFELVSFPEGKAYEQNAPRLLWHPGHPER
ncbi:VOC family protein [Microbacterium sp. NPDC058389]|uniref:VOC family protein n=1 Tax=Microbacterium sp. NPDC058389 TaxID=3346475 RepID=UPI0036484DB6